jgi:hypothetical protein
MADQKVLRLSATLLFIGLVFSSLMQFPHPPGGATIEATFANYAASRDWAAIHLGQFVAEAILLAGLLVLFFALNLSAGPPRWVGFFGATAAGVALALAAVLFAVDGVALKQAVDAWASAPAAEQATRFAGAETIRWLEWGTNSYWEFMRGLACVLFAITIVWTARVPRPVGYLMGVAGLAFILLGWSVGTRGFTPATTIPMYASYTALFAVTIWLLIVAWRRTTPVAAAQAQPQPA